jgi:hypothetical protein
MLLLLRLPVLWHELVDAEHAGVQKLHDVAVVIPGVHRETQALGIHRKHAPREVVYLEVLHLIRTAGRGLRELVLHRPYLPGSSIR